MAGVGKIVEEVSKKHELFVSPILRRVGTRSLPLPGGSGFLRISGTADYSAETSEILLTITSTARPHNRGPGIFIKSRRPWTYAQNANGGGRRLLDAELALVAARISAKTLPVRGIFLDACNTSGASLGTMLSTVCSTCTCWYCDML